MSTSPRLVAALLIAGALVAGVVLGVAGDRAWMHWHRNSPRAPHLDRLVEHLDRTLDLTPQQRESVKQIIDRHRQRIEAISASVRPQMRQEIDSTNAEIEKILTPEQRTKFRDMQQRHINRRGPRGMRPALPPPADAH